ncbi:MAG TPA: chemotaxis protein CheW [Magnetospirillaceae bacterium]|jgi:purine-binding chemotaxis protein CheW
MTQTAQREAQSGQDVLGGVTEFVTFNVGGYMFGVPVLRVQDTLIPDRIATVPLAPPEVRGSINLRGRIVTVIDMRRRLGLSDAGRPAGNGMGVTVESGSELYTLLVDNVGDVITLPLHLREANPNTLDPLWRDLAGGTYRLEDRLMVVLEIDRLLDLRAKN